MYCIHACTHIYIYIYIYTYICKCTQAHIYIYIYIYREREREILLLQQTQGCCFELIRPVFRNCIVFFGPRPWHIEIRHRVKQTSTINLLGFETLELTIRRLKLWTPTVVGDILAKSPMPQVSVANGDLEEAYIHI